LGTTLFTGLFGLLSVRGGRIRNLMRIGRLIRGLLIIHLQRLCAPRLLQLRANLRRLLQALDRRLMALQNALDHLHGLALSLREFFQPLRVLLFLLDHLLVRRARLMRLLDQVVDHLLALGDLLKHLPLKHLPLKRRIRKRLVLGRIHAVFSFFCSFLGNQSYHCPPAVFYSGHAARRFIQYMAAVTRGDPAALKRGARRKPAQSPRFLSRLSVSIMRMRSSSESVYTTR